MLKYPLTIIFKRKDAESQSFYYCFASSRLCVFEKHIRLIGFTVNV